MSYQLQEIEIEKVSIRCVAFSHTGSYIAAGSNDKTIRVWKLSTGKEVLQLKHGNRVNTVMFNYDDTRLLSGSQDKTLRIWDATTGRLILNLKHDTWVLSAAFTHDGRLVSSTYDDEQYVWDANTGKELRYIRWETKTNCVALNHNDSQVASACEDNLVRIWDPDTCKIEATFAGHTGSVTCVTFSSDGSMVISGSEDESVRVFHVKTRDQLFRLQHDETVKSVAWNGSSIVSGSRDEIVRVWNLHEGKYKLEELNGHEATVNSVAFNHDGTLIVSGSDDWTVRVWKVPTILYTQVGTEQKVDDTCGVENFDTYATKRMTDGILVSKQPTYSFNGEQSGESFTYQFVDKDTTYMIKCSHASAEVLDIKIQGDSIFKDASPNISGSWTSTTVEIENVFFQDAKGKGLCTMAVSYLLKALLHDAAKRREFPYLGTVYIFSKMPCRAVNCYTHAFMNNSFMPNAKEMNDFKKELFYWKKRRDFKYTFKAFYSSKQWDKMNKVSVKLKL